jgi:leucyl-tRNA synthetase
MSTKRRDALLEIQTTSQALWDAARLFEEDAPESASNIEQPKFLCTFPYPYSNGKLHLGHAFTVSKAEFATGYKRLVGFRCLYPFGFHTTGMPIQACANKLKKELDLYGNPPVFPDTDEVQPGDGPEDGSMVSERVVPVSPADVSVASLTTPPAVLPTNGSEPNSSPSPDKNPARATKGKLASKASRFKYQWEILKESGVPEDIIARFADPVAWLDYFPAQGVADLKRFGLKADWRRSFITTSVNPYYDSFIRWQFNTLRSLNKVKFGKRYTVFSTVDNQGCADHDRSAGEGIKPQEYTLIKMKLLRLPEVEGALALHGRTVYLPAATLRPETMYGQTNCWVLPTGEYSAYEVVGGDVFICSQHSAQNMAYQSILPHYGVASPIASFTGSDLIGLPLRAPHATYDTIYVLPLLTVSMSKGTGVVTSVPSDAPDDYRGLMDLKEKAPLRSKFGVKDDWVLPFEPVPIIETPGFGNLAAVVACERRKIKSQNDKEGLSAAKEEVYKAGFYSGTMIVGSMKGAAVQIAKSKIRDEMIASGHAMAYAEPEGRVVDRNGVECVVAFCDQWYLEYGEKEWRAQAETCLASMELYAEETRKAMSSILDWLKEWACSRSFGLGTRLPWDAEWLIESLSDSTIYMAYYTVAHLLQGGVENMNGQKIGPIGLTPAQMTDAAWDYILLGKAASSGSVDVVTLDRLRKEFLYWYPVDLRVSGKDLVGNHLAFYIYNHVAIFKERHWPAGMRVNGHVTLNAEKMSKSTGNFITLDQAIEMYTADGVRFALADAGDTGEDANFATKTADDAVLKLWTLVDFVEEGIKMIPNMRKGDLELFHDRVFAERIEDRTQAAHAAYEHMLFREALKAGFHELVNDLGKYRVAVGADKTSSTFANLHRALFIRFVEHQTILLSPLCPHVSEHMWGLIRQHLPAVDGVARPETIMRARWPVMRSPDIALLAADEYLNEVLSRIRTALMKPVTKKKKAKGEIDASLPRDTVILYVCREAPQWQAISLQVLKEQFDFNRWESTKASFPQDESKWWKYPSNLPKLVTAALPSELRKNKRVMPFVAKVRKDVEHEGMGALVQSLPFDEQGILSSNLSFMKDQLRVVGISKVEIFVGEAPEGYAEALPGVPGLGFLSSATGS